MAGEKWHHRRVSRICDTGYITLPRSLTRYARSFGCGERYLRSHNKLMCYPQIQGIRHHTTCAQEEKMLRKRPRPGAFSIGSAPLTSITKSDAQISGGETRCGLKIPGVSARWLPRAPPHSCHSVTDVIPLLWPRFSHSTPDTQFRVGSSLQDGLYARTPRSVRLPRPFR